MSKCAPKALFNRGLTILDVSIASRAIGAKLMNINICIVLCIIIGDRLVPQAQSGLLSQVYNVIRWQNFGNHEVKPKISQPKYI
jgi:hypothetical protein